MAVRYKTKTFRELAYEQESRDAMTKTFGFVLVATGALSLLVWLDKFLRRESAPEEILLQPKER